MSDEKMGQTVGRRRALQGIVVGGAATAWTAPALVGSAKLGAQTAGTPPPEPPPAATKTWERRADLPEGREGAGGAFINGLFYMSHGLASGAGDTAHLRIYDPGTDLWAIGTSATAVRSELVGATVGGLYYAIGGRTTPNTSVVEIYDPSLGTWGAGAPMPTGRGGLGADVLAGKIHVVGGRPGGSPGSGPALSVHEVYDPVADSWSSAAPMTVARQDIYATCAFGGKLYVFGGGDSAATPLASGEMYDPATDSWSPIAPMPTARGNAMCGICDGRIFVIGGSNPLVVNRTVVEVYNPLTNTWSTGPALPVDGSEFAVGGCTNDNPSSPVKILAAGSGIFGAARAQNLALIEA